jgi:hypothetical protein
MMPIEVTTNTFFGVNFFFYLGLNKIKQSIKAVKSSKNTLKPSEFVVFYFVLILLGVGNPHRSLQFGIVRIKTFNFLPQLSHRKSYSV